MTQGLDAVLAKLRGWGVTFTDGLDDREITEAENLHRFRFPPDLRQMLMTALPIGDRFPNWRESSSTFIADRMAWPANGICFDVERNAFWHPDWPEKPENGADAVAVARRELAMAPVLIPIFGHRYLPAEPHQSGNPIFSVYQTDTIIYGKNLCDYLIREFDPNRSDGLPEPERDIPFWSQLVDLNVGDGRQLSTSGMNPPKQDSNED